MSKIFIRRFAGMEPTNRRTAQNRQYVSKHKESPFSARRARRHSRADCGAAQSEPTGYREPPTPSSAYYGLNRETYSLGNGSDELFVLLLPGVLRRKNALCFADITYGYFEVFARVRGAVARYPAG
jgi:histidinol-phosphate/aromatic aminotransferase/cobyric acid decarboxylase-like protein